MVLKKKLKAASKALVFVFMVLLFSCENLQVNLLNCSECVKDEPSSAEINVKLTSNGNQILVKIYEGNLEDSLLYKSFAAIGKTATYSLPLNKTFTFTAIYFSVSGKQYITVNSITPRVRYVKDQCDEPCYFVYDNSINLRLKYMK
jgi:hypothetical protein